MRIEALLFMVMAILVAPVHGHSDATGFADQGKDEPADEDPGVEANSVIEVDSGLIRTATVERRDVMERRAGIGTVVAEVGATHDVNSFISGQIKEVFVRPGSRVSKGDPIALIESPEFVLIQRSYTALLGNDEKLGILEGEGRLGNYVDDARENLRWWGLSEEDIQRLEKTGETLSGISVHAEFNGVISEVLVQAGDLLNAGDRKMAQFVVMGQVIARVIPDEKPLWIESLMYPNDVAGVHAGDSMLRVHLPGGELIEYPVESVSPSLDPDRQLVRLMVKLEERGGFYLGQPLRVELMLGRWEETWLPRAALMRQGFETVVFVEQEQGSYDRRRVEAGAVVDDWVAVSGLEAGTRVVTHGKMALEGAYRLVRAGVTADDHHH